MVPRTLIIAEAGVNHNGNIEMAKQLIEVAAKAGADVVKFQTFSAEKLVTSKAPKADYQVINDAKSDSQRSMLQRLELSKEAHEVLKEHCVLHGIRFLSTGFDIASVDFLIQLGIDWIKIPSGELTNLPYLRHVASLELPVILSTGMATLDEIEAAINILESQGLTRQQLTVLHCNTEYPTPMCDVNLHAMRSIQTHFDVNIGYSDHTMGIEIAIAAVAMGAAVIEKHLTLDRQLPGPDHAASLQPEEFVAMVSAIRNIELALGDGVKRPSNSEKKNIPIARRSLVASMYISAGQPFTSENITAKRPGTGISPMQWDEVVGRIATRNFEVDELISL